MEQNSAAKRVDSIEDLDTGASTTIPIGQKIRLAFELVNSKSAARESLYNCATASKKASDLPSNTIDNLKSSNKESVMPNDGISVDGRNEIQEILSALKLSSNQENVCLCQQLELLVRFDELEGWRESGAKNCASWMNAELQIDLRTGWERLRVGRQLRELPFIQSFFESGRLSWSKVRLLTRIACLENESMLVHASLDATVSDVQRLCEEYRWPLLDDSESDTLRANLQWERRRLNWRQLPDGSTQIRIVLPPEQAQNFLHAIEQCEELIYEDNKNQSNRSLQVDQHSKAVENEGGEKEFVENEFDENEFDENKATENAARETTSSLSSSQRKADAAVLLAERSIAFNGEHSTPADRYQVVLNIDIDSLAQNTNQSDSGKPSRNPVIEGVGRVPISSARQIACDCSVIKLLTEQGEPLSVGRKRRLWTPSMRRAILTRDRHCQFTGCTSHRFLQIHHIKHWADGGETSVDNGVCLCQFHHQLVHSGDFDIKRATVNTDSLLSTGLYSSSKKQLLPTRCRFVVERVVKPAAEIILNSCDVGIQTPEVTPNSRPNARQAVEIIPKRQADTTENEADSCFVEGDGNVLNENEKQPFLSRQQRTVEEPVPQYQVKFESPRLVT